MPVSVIIPTWNEAASLGDTIAGLRKQQPHEIIVADGGSTDATRAAAAGADRFVEAPRGRAVQMNAGSAFATGDVLLFLHADCSLEAGGIAQAEHYLRRSNVAAGCFTMRVAAEGLIYRWIDFATTARVRLTGMIFGDQGLFLSREAFCRVGGFPMLRLMEDVYLSARLRRLGRVVVAPARIHVSPRRWQRSGILRQTVRNWTLLTLAAAGVHPDSLAAHYPNVR
jgi:rSAM/selenodomain-associated transferase 2